MTSFPPSWQTRIDHLSRLAMQSPSHTVWLLSGVPDNALRQLMHLLTAQRLDISPDQVLRHPDVMLVTPSDEVTGTGRQRLISVEDIRDVLDRVSLTSFGQTKVLLVEVAHLLSDAAQNAMLKTLEDPAGELFAMFITPYPDRLLPTLRSRMAHIAFPPFGEIIWTGDTSLDPLHFLQADRAGRFAFITRLLKSTKEDIPLLAEWLDALLAAAHTQGVQATRLMEEILTVKEGLEANNNPAILLTRISSV